MCTQYNTDMKEKAKVRIKVSCVRAYAFKTATDFHITHRFLRARIFIALTLFSP